MNMVQTRGRRWNSRTTTNAGTAPNASSTPNGGTPLTGVGQNELAEPMLYQNFQTENRIIYETPEVTLRPLPFFDLIDQLIKPAGLISDGVVARLNESHVEFKLTIEQADMVAMSINNSKQILLRFCHLDSTSEQDDNFPPDAVISVNGANVALPQAVSNPNKPNIPPKRPGQHVDITKLCKLCPFVQNSITVKWYVDPSDPSRSYVINVIIAEKIGADLLMLRIKERGASDPELTKKLILDSDNEVATTNLQSSLVCPLGKMRMSVPCKSVNCKHIPCFDALFYLQMNEKKASWICPVCYKPAYYRDLKMDGFFMNILENAAANVTEVTLNLDGSWSPITKLELPASAKNPQPEVITISDDDEE